MKKIIFIMYLFACQFLSWGQGYNHTWLMGTSPGLTMGRINFFTDSLNLILEPQRKMSFKGTQGNISDINGNFLMSSNGVWIANAHNDTMMNGSGLNPGSFVDSWHNGLPLPYANVILPWPDSSHKFILIHQTYNNTSSPSSDLYYSTIDITLANGLGAVVEKNIVFTQGAYAWGINACKHANGRDWWIIALSDSLNKIHTYLLTPNGIQFNSTQSFAFSALHGTSGQSFSPDGNKFAFTNVISLNPGTYEHDIRLLNFDRCNGNFFNPLWINITDSIGGRGISFSSNSKYLYVTKFDKVLQFNSDTTDILNSMRTVAIYDGFTSPFATDFWLPYLAADGKIYITSGSAVNHHHVIEYPNLFDTLCDVNQHSLDLNGIWSYRAIPNHPNYYLGCDTTLGCTPCYIIPNVNENGGHDFKFNIYPNPSNGNFNITYLLPQNKEGKLEVFDMTGKVVYEMRLPQWSTLQQIRFPSYLSNGLYNCVVTSDGYRISKKIAVMKD